MQMPAEFYMEIIKNWPGTPDEKYAQWNSTYNDVSPPPTADFTTDQEVADYLAAHCDHDW